MEDRVRSFALSVVILVLALASVACAAPAPTAMPQPTPTATPQPLPTATPVDLGGLTERIVPFDDLVLNPEGRVGARLCTQGVAVFGSGVDALLASVTNNGVDLFMSEPAIWTEGALRVVQGKCLDGSNNGAPLTYCEAVVCGRFDYGGAYGPDGLFSYLIH